MLICTDELIKDISPKAFFRLSKTPQCIEVVDGDLAFELIYSNNRDFLRVIMRKIRNVIVSSMKKIELSPCGLSAEEIKWTDEDFIIDIEAIAKTISKRKDFKNVVFSTTDEDDLKTKLQI